jgi:hypothetical protein
MPGISALLNMHMNYVRSPHLCCLPTYSGLQMGVWQPERYKRFPKLGLALTPSSPEGRGETAP